MFINETSRQVFGPEREIRPIETLYRGYRFRSRLKARWAVYFDSLGCDWEYEPQGFDLGDGVLYLPDFYVGWRKGSEARMCWAEVKPETLTEPEDKKATLFAGHVGDLILLIGTPGPFSYPLLGQMSDCEAGGPRVFISDVILGQHKGRGRFYTSTGKESNGREPVRLTEDEFDYWADQIAEPIMAARSARFEHGENTGGL